MTSQSQLVFVSVEFQALMRLPAWDFRGCLKNIFVFLAKLNLETAIIGSSYCTNSVLGLAFKTLSLFLWSMSFCVCGLFCYLKGFHRILKAFVLFFPCPHFLWKIAGIFWPALNSLPLHNNTQVKTPPSEARTGRVHRNIKVCQFSMEKSLFSGDVV